MPIQIAGANKSINDLSAQLQKRTSVNTEVKFGDELKNVSAAKHRETLFELTKGIFEQGEIVSERCDIKEFKKYKELITEFFNEVTASGYEFGKNQTTDGRGRKKLYANIKRVNTDMEKLATELLKSQKNQVEILAMVEDIRGIIIDVLA